MVKYGSNSRNRYLIAIVGWLAISAAIVLTLGQLNVFPYLQLIRGGSTTVGSVVTLEPTKHDSVVARFTVNGADHVVTRSFVAKPNPEKSFLAVGDAVTVYFLPDSPTTAALGDPRYLLPHELFAVGAAALVFPTLLVGALHWRTRQRRGSS